MDFSKIINPECIMLALEVESKEELIGILAERAELLQPESSKKFSTEEIIEAVMERERQGGWVMRDGFILLHARLVGLSQIVIVVGILKKPIDLGSPDEVPIDIVPFMLAPEDQANLALKTMAELIREIKKSKELIRQAVRRREVVAIFSGRKVNLDEPIIAADIHHKPLCKVSPDQTLKEVTRIMAEHQVEAVPVCDENDKVVGEISNDLLFHLGVPDFFKSLKSVSFISDFDPFEEYYRGEARVKVEDVMNKDIMVMHRENTILEVIFELTVKNRPMIYIERDNKLIGIIDKSTVLNKIINL